MRAKFAPQRTPSAQDAAASLPSRLKQWGVRLLSTQNPAEQLQGGAGVYSCVQTCNPHITPQSIHRIPRVGKRTSRRPGEQIDCFPNKSTGSSSISPDARALRYCHPYAAGSGRFELVDRAREHKFCPVDTCRRFSALHVRPPTSSPFFYAL